MMKSFVRGLGVFTITIVTVAIAGCVSSSRHREEVGKLQTQVDKENADIGKLKTEVQNLSFEKGQVEEKLAATTKDRGQLRTSLEDMKKAVDEMARRSAVQQQRLKDFRDLTDRFKKLTDAGTLSVKIIDGKMVVTMGSDVLFSSGSAHLSAAGLEAIKEVSRQLAALGDKRFQIEGHTDNIPIASATFPSNWELASARALTVLKTMIEAGMPANRVSAASFADTQPVKPNDTPEGRAANRRIEIVVVPDLSTLPGYDELNKVGAEGGDPGAQSAAPAAPAAK